MIQDTGPIMTLAGAARCLGMPVATLAGHARRGSIEVLRVGRTRFVTQAEVCRFFRHGLGRPVSDEPDWSKGRLIEYTGVLMSLSEAAHYLGLRHGTVKDAFRDGRLEGGRISDRAIAVTREAADRYRIMREGAVRAAAREEGLIPLAKAADRLGMKPGGVDTARRRGRIRGVFRGHRWFFEPEELERFLLEHQRRILTGCRRGVWGEDWWREDGLLTLAEAARAVGVSRSAVRHAIHSGKIPVPMRVRGRLLLHRDVVFGYWGHRLERRQLAATRGAR